MIQPNKCDTPNIISQFGGQKGTMVTNHTINPMAREDKPKYGYFRIGCVISAKVYFVSSSKSSLSIGSPIRYIIFHEKLRKKSTNPQT
ncbi:hypothetical protein ACFL1A_00685 [Patescibacteria group bacterium]